VSRAAERPWWIAAILLGAIYGFHHVGDPDVFQQVAVGRAILADPRAIGMSNFVESFPSYSYVEDKWLPSVAAATFDRLGPGGDGLAALQLLVGIALAGSWFAAFRAASGGPAAAAAATALALVAIAFRVGPRPDTWSLALLGVAVALFLRVRDPRRLALAFAGLMAAWVNVHGYFVNGLLVAVAAAVAAALGDESVPALASAPTRRARGMRGVAVLACGSVACGLHPQGFRAALAPFAQLRELLAGASLREAILEFQPTSVLLSGAGPVHIAAVALTLGAAAALAWRGEVGPRARAIVAAVAASVWLAAPPDGLRQWPYRVTAAMLAAASIAIVPVLRRRGWFLGILLAGFVVLAAPVIRNVALVPLAAGLALVAGLDPPRDRVANRSGARRGWAIAAVVAVALAGGLRVFDRLPPGHYRAPERTGWGIDPALLPERAVSYALAAGLPGPWLNTFDHGGYLLYRSHPDRAAFIAGNTAMYPGEFLASYRRDLIRAADPGREIRRRGFRSAVVGLTAPESTPIVRALARDPEWSLVEADPGGAVFLRDGGASDRRQDLAERLAEAVRAGGSAAGTGRPPIWPSMNVAVFLRDLGRSDDAWAAWQAIAGTSPSDDVLALGAEIAEGAGRLADLVDALEDGAARSAPLRAWSARARYFRAVRALERGDASGAVRDAEIAAARVPDAPGPYVVLASALLRLGRTDEARTALARAVERDADGAIRRAIAADPELAVLVP